MGNICPCSNLQDNCRQLKKKLLLTDHSNTRVKNIPHILFLGNQGAGKYLGFMFTHSRSWFPRFL
jgi:hypothetical protein